MHCGLCALAVKQIATRRRTSVAIASRCLGPGIWAPAARPLTRIALRPTRAPPFGGSSERRAYTNIGARRDDGACPFQNQRSSDTHAKATAVATPIVAVAVKKAPKQLPAPNSDFCQLADVLTTDEKAMAKKVRTLEVDRAHGQAAVHAKAPSPVMALPTIRFWSRRPLNPQGVSNQL
jgi:hypothetical protein